MKIIDLNIDVLLNPLEEGKLYYSYTTIRGRTKTGITKLVKLQNGLTDFNTFYSFFTRKNFNARGGILIPVKSDFVEPNDIVGYDAFEEAIYIGSKIAYQTSLKHVDVGSKNFVVIGTVIGANRIQIDHIIGTFVDKNKNQSPRLVRQLFTIDDFLDSNFPPSNLNTYYLQRPNTTWPDNDGNIYVNFDISKSRLISVKHNNKNYVSRILACDIKFKNKR